MELIRRAFTVVAPDLLRANSQENIYLEASGLPGPVPVSIYIRDFSKSTVLFKDSFTLGPEHSYHMLRGIQLSSDHLMPGEHKNKFVYLTVNFHGYHEEERVMMVSFQQEGTVVKQVFQTMAVDGVRPESFTLYNNAKSHYLSLDQTQLDV
ncbi:unnamed protein product [Merluccius merluccius]